MHARPPAFGGTDGRAYTVSTLIDLDPAPDAHGRFGAALLFVCWADGSERPVGHLETDYLAFGPTADEAVAPLLTLPLRDVKRHLDRCIEKARESGRGADAS